MKNAFGLKWAVVMAGAMLLVLAAACGEEVVKEVVKEVPVEVVKEVEVIVEVVKEVEVIKEVPKVVTEEKVVVKEVEVVVVATPVPVGQPEKPPTAEGGMEGFPVPGEKGVPADVGKLTVAMDSWGPSDINPWTLSSAMFLQDLFNGTVMRQAPNGVLMPYWAVSFELDAKGITYHLNPDAKFQDGTPADAQAMKENFDAIAGYMDVEQYGYDKPAVTRGRTVACCESFEVISPTELRVHTKGPRPAINAVIGGHGYHALWMGNPTRIKQGLDAYLKDPAGFGPFKLVQWEAGSRAVMERWDDYWADYPWYRKPQYRELEVLAVPDHAARFALLKSEQVDMVYNIPWPIAKDLARSEKLGKRGVNPEQGDLWTQSYEANGMLAMNFALPHRKRNTIEKWPEGSKDAGGVPIVPYTFKPEWENDPTMDSRVREALNLAIDKRAISEGPHFGFSHPTGSIYMRGTFGSRLEQINNISPYDPARAKALLAEAGYPNGFEIQGHFGQFAGRPGIPEMVDAISSYWKDIGVTVSWQEHDPSDWGQGFRRGKLSWTQFSLPTMGRTEHNVQRVGGSFHITGNSQHPHPHSVEALYFKLLRTIDEAEQKRILAEIEDKVLAQKELFPLYGMSLVMGYTDRVLSHPTVAESPHLKHIDLITLRK